MLLAAWLLAFETGAARVVQKEPDASAQPLATFPRIFPHAAAFQALAHRPPAGPPAAAWARGFAGLAAPRSAPPLAQMANDGEEVDWDTELGKLSSRLKETPNPYVQEMAEIELPQLLREFAETAPKPVQFAVTATVASLLGKMPDALMEQEITTTGKALGSLLFNMQMTGYMFRNAEYRRSLMQSMEKALPVNALPQDVKVYEDPQDPGKLPPISGTVKVKLGEGMEAEVDAEAYMAELRGEVEELRSQLAGRTSGGEGDEALIMYIQAMEQGDREALMQDVSEEILEAMSQLVSKLLIDLNIEGDQEVSAPAEKLRELLVVQLVSGYKLRELQVLGNMKDSFWGADGGTK